MVNRLQVCFFWFGINGFAASVCVWYFLGGFLCVCLIYITIVLYLFSAAPGISDVSFCVEYTYAWVW